MPGRPRAARRTSPAVLPGGCLPAGLPAREHGLLGREGGLLARERGLWVKSAGGGPVGRRAQTWMSVATSKKTRQAFSAI